LNSELLELKATVKSLETVRRRLLDLKAVYVGTFRQVDTYFSSNKGRLKLREIDDKDKAQLIYYFREDITGPEK
jgi:adenylate cyclase class 2